MISFGFLTLYKHQEEEYITEIAKHAKDFGIEVYRFTPTSIKPTTELIDGYFFNDENQTWEKRTFPVPQFLYDRCFYQMDDISKKSFPIVNWLKNNPNTIFIGHGLPNKWHIYEQLSSDSILKHYIPKTIKATTAHDILMALKKDKKILLKPDNGTQGKGIIAVLTIKEKFILKNHKNQEIISKQISSKDEFILFMNKLIQAQNYLLQPLLPLIDENNCAFDLRILLQKDMTGKWIEQGRGIRKNRHGHFISNVYGGGEIIPFNKWNQSRSKLQQAILHDELSTILTRLPYVLETKFSPLFEIGIDIGIDQDDKVWILDVNSKPGRKVILQTNPNKQTVLYQAPLRYCLHLAKQNSFI